MSKYLRSFHFRLSFGLEFHNLLFHKYFVFFYCELSVHAQLKKLIHLKILTYQTNYIQSMT